MNDQTRNESPDIARFMFVLRHYKVPIILLLIIISANIGFILLLGMVDKPLVEARVEQSERFVAAQFVDENRAFVFTIGNDLLELAAGQTINQTKLPVTIGGLIAEQDRIYVGTTDGKIVELDHTLENAHEITLVAGRVVAMKALQDQSGYLIAHGVGPFSDQYWVSRFTYDSKEPLYSTQTEFTISAIDALDNRAYYGTANARLGAIDAETGEILWKVVASRPITALVALPDQGGVVAGDERGNVLRVDGNGEVEWETTITQYQIRTLVFDDDHFFIGDSFGNIFIIGHDGQVQRSFQAAEGDIVAIYPLDSGSWAIVPRNGPWMTFHPSVLDNTVLVSGLHTIWSAINLTLIPLLAVAALLVNETANRATRRVLMKMWRQRVGYVLLLPALILILIFGYYPVLTSVYYSMTNFSLRSPTTEFIGLENYWQILTKDVYFRIGFKNTLFIIITNVLKTVTMPLLVAELIFWLRRSSHAYIFRTLFLLPAVIPGLISVYMWRMVYDPYDGLLNQLLAILGINTNIAWLSNESTALGAVIGAGFPYIGAFPLLIYLGGLLNINSEIFDSAKIDGATTWDRFWKIDVPLLATQTRLLLFFSFSGAISGFASILIFTGGGPGTTTYVPGLQMYFKIAEGNLGYASAIGGIMFVLIFIGTLYIVRFRQFVASTS